MPCTKYITGALVGAFLIVAGITLIVMGATISTILDNRIENEINAALPINRAEMGEEDWQKWLTPEDPDEWIINLYHVDNARAVLEDGAKPILEERTYDLNLYYTKYAVEVFEDIVKYREHTRFEDPNNNFDETVVTINPVYAGGIATPSVGTEEAFMTSFTSAVVSEIGPQFSDGAGALLSSFRVLSIPGYLNGALQALSLDPTYTSLNLNTTTKVQLQWATKAPLGGEGVFSGGAGRVGPEYQLWIGFELETAINTTHIEALWNPSNPIALTNTNANQGIQLWLLIATSPDCDNDVACAGAKSLITNAGLGGDTAAFDSVLLWLTKLALLSGAQGGYYDSSYFAAVKLGLPQATNDDTTWGHIGGLQFGAGGATRPAGADSVTQLIDLSEQGLPVAPEFYAWQILEKGKNSTTAETMTGTQGLAFLETFADGDNVTAFFVGLVTNPTGVFTNPIFVSCGITPSNVGTYAEFLSSWLPEEFGFKTQFVGPLGDNGVGAFNGGLFVERSVREILFGYLDPFIALARSAGQEVGDYTGVLGPNMTLEEHQAAEPAYFAVNTGTSDLSKLQEWVLYNNREQLTTWEDQGYECPPGFTIDDDECKVWQTQESIKGCLSGGGVMPQYSDAKDMAPQEEIVFWVNEISRNISLEYDREDQYLGIDMRRYRAEGSVLNINPNYRVSEYAIQPLQSAKGGAPIVGSLPHMMNASETIRSKFVGKTPEDWDEVSLDKYGTYLDLEPITGRFMKGALRLQLNVDIQASMFNSAFHRTFTTYPEDNSYYFPSLWIEKSTAIEPDDAADFRDAVYGTQDLGDSLTIMGLALGPILFIAGAVMVLVFWRCQKIKSQEDLASLRQHTGDLELAN